MTIKFFRNTETPRLKVARLPRRNTCIWVGPLFILVIGGN